MRYEFSEVLNDLIDYFLIGDILLLKRYQLENGWYEVEVPGGEVSRNGGFEPTFEFVMKKTDAPGDASQIDINYRFAIHWGMEPTA